MDGSSEQSYSRKKILPAFLIMLVGATALYLLMNFLQPYLLENEFLYSFDEMMAGCMEGSLLASVWWFFADWTEGSFIAALPASIGMIIMGFIAATLERKRSKHAGSGVDGNGKVFTSMFAATAISLVLGQLLFGWLFPNGWLPTFAVVLTVQVFVIFYGNSIPKMATSIIVGTVITFPICYGLLYGIVIPAGLPLFIAISIGVAITVPLCSLLFRLMPWMTKREPDAEKGPEPTPSNFFVHRVFGDIGELTLWGSSWATIGMYIGGIISWVLNPLHPAYGSGNFPLLIFAQIVTAACAIFIYYPIWKKESWAFTFAGIVFVSAIVSTYPPEWIIIIPTIIIGVLAFAPLVPQVLKLFRYKGNYHVIALIQVSIFTVCTLWSLIVLHGIVPLLG